MKRGTKRWLLLLAVGVFSLLQPASPKIEFSLHVPNILPCAVGSISVKSEAEFPPLYGKVIFLDPGHGFSSDAGGSYKGFLEHKYNLMLAKTVQRDLQELGATVILTRSGAGDVNNLARMSMVNLYALEAVKEKYQALLNKEGEGERAAFYGEHIREIGLLQEVMRLVIERPEFCTVYYNAPYDYTYTRAIHPDLKRIFEYEDDPLVYENMLFLSLHSNATGEPVDEGMNGTITYYLDNNWYGSKAYYRDYACVRQNRFFAHVLAEKVSAAGDFTNLGEAVNDFFMMRETNIPAVLLEVAYHTNDLDRQKLMSEAYRDKISGGIADSVLEYFSYIGQQKTALGV